MGSTETWRLEPEPEWQLFGAIVRQAITEAVRGACGGTTAKPGSNAKQANQERAEQWFYSPNFEYLCSLFAVDAADVRPAALASIKYNRGTNRSQVDWQPSNRRHRRSSVRERSARGDG